MSLLEAPEIKYLSFLSNTVKRKPGKANNPGLIKSVALLQLRELAVELKRTPYIRDIHVAARQGKCSSMWKLTRAFGTMREALKAAKLPLNIKQEFSKHE